MLDSLPWWISGLIALLFALIHVCAGKLKFLDTTPRSRWLSLGGGISVAYVFVHVLPDLSAAQREFQYEVSALEALEHHVYLLAMLGMLAFYGLERTAKASRQESQQQGEGDNTQPGVFWLHMVSFSLYNMLIGYLLTHREEVGLRGLILYAIAMAVHFVVNDFSLNEDHKRAYRKLGRWILSGAIVFGWVLGTRITLSQAATASLFGLLAGSIVLNVLKEELPEARESRFFTFALGAVGYAGLLLAL